MKIDAYILKLGRGPTGNLVLEAFIKSYGHMEDKHDELPNK